MKLHNQALNRLFDEYGDAAERERLRQEWVPHIQEIAIAVISRTVDHFVKEWRRLPTIVEFLDYAVIEEEQQSKRQRQIRVNQCPACDHGHIITQHEPLTVRPCEQCCPEAYDAWITGQYEPSGSI